MLRAVRASGWRIGILTNGFPEIQARKVRALGLEALVDAVVYAQDWGSGRGKPEREPFDVLAARLGLEARASVFVGNDPWCDVIGGRGAGMRTILLQRAGADGRGVAADRTVDAIEDVPKAAAGLLCREVADAA